MKKEYDKYRRFCKVFEGTSSKLAFVTEEFGPGIHVASNTKINWSVKSDYHNEVLKELSLQTHVLRDTHQGDQAAEDVRNSGRIG